MGVVYKFKPEVVEFIIQQKKENASLSCRDLKERVAQYFHIDVSKSSINNILKKASLNSPPRRPAHPKKFKIPQAKKKQLMEGLKKAAQERVPIFSASQEKKVVSQERHLNKPLLKEKKDKPALESQAGMIFLKVAALEASMDEYISLLDKDSKKIIKQPADAYMKKYFETKFKEFIGLDKVVVHLKDGNRLCFDPGFSTVWNSEIPKAFSLLLNKGLENLSRIFISNKYPVIFYHISEENFADVVSVFENMNGRQVTHIDIFGESGKLAAFDTIPAKKRFFISGVQNGQKYFPDWTKNVQSVEKKQGFIHILNQPIEFYDGVDTLEVPHKVSLRVLVLWKRSEKTPFLVLLTNNIKIKDEQIIHDYFMRWPSLDFNQYEILFKTNPQKPEKEAFFSLLLKEKILPIEKLSEDFKDILHAYCQQRFFQGAFQRFSREQAEAVIYNLLGRKVMDSQSVTVTLSVPKFYPHRLLLQKAAWRVNQGNVYDRQGRRYLIFI